MESGPSKLEALFESLGDATTQKSLANLVMTGGARPLHMCGMSRGGDASSMVALLVKYGAEVNAKDNYEYTPVDRLASNAVQGIKLLKSHGAVSGKQMSRGQPVWDSTEFDYDG